MTDLTIYVPDTSKYTDPADRLIALGLALKSVSGIQAGDKWGWCEPDRHLTLLERCDFLLNAGGNYRAKPEPRVVWANFYKYGFASHHESAEIARSVADGDAIAIAVRVELPDDQ